MAHPWIDVSEAPLYRLTLFKAKAPEQEWEPLVESWMQTTRDFYAQLDHPLGWVVDARFVPSSRSTSQQRHRLRQHLNDTAPVMGQWCAAAAIIIDKAAVRGVLTALHWISPPAYPQKVFATPEEGEAWVRPRLDAALDAHGWATGRSAPVR